ncbi:hypothetical protein SpiGrapes_1970 [Sphaerochaeta pleomorpha str. Grapes]|uniref:Uncharacterized protein n=1 Tax=Sphaerochaeta pleomorpha (strain ATCC BAA-1885 / DSM 22778 / Grapes) TaxID=158190 RepID=G8QQB2_SPHPG|nr:hypothetical protein [Sphaerochaeta pleomorpha]AEV29757.1 hypothetical protein SpiGrapes_1970 [Sphaerochaeta pleomorpha str. Grapes]
MNMKNKKFAIVMILIVVAVASVSAASYGNSRFANTAATQNQFFGRGNANAYSQTCLVTGEEPLAGTRMGIEGRGYGMYGSQGLDAELRETCLVTGEAPVYGSRLGSGMRWSR